MPYFLRAFSHSRSLLFVLIFITFTDLAIIFDIPILRQVLGLLLIVVLPGLLILFLLKLDRLGTAEKIVLTVGLSAAFVMFFGWMLNQVSLQIGHARPLAIYTLMPSISGILVILAVGAYVRNKDAFSTFPFKLELNTTGKLCLLIPVVFLLISIIGTHYLNTTGNNIILIVLLFLISISIIMISLLGNKISQDTYPVAIILLSAALLFMYWLRSEHITGHDVHTEYYIFHTTLVNSHWSVLENTWVTQASAVLDSCLSVSVLPAVFQSLIDVDAVEYLFKGVYVLICIFMPLAIYIISKKHIGGRYAFLAAFFFASQTGFLIAAGNTRTNLAIFFFALSIVVLFHDEITGMNRKGLFIIFMAATVVSHYSTTYIFLFLLLCTFLLSFVFRKYCFSRAITLTGIALMAVLIFLWYEQLTQYAFESGVQFTSDTIRDLPSIFVAEARAGEPSKALALGMEDSILKWIHWGIQWLCLLFIAVGVIVALIKRKEMILAPQYGNTPPGYTRRKFETEFLIAAFFCAVLLLAALAFPYIEKGYDTERLNNQMTVLLSGFFIIGGIIISRYLRINPLWLILIVLIPRILFVTGAIEEALGHHVKYWLDSEAPEVSYELVYDQEIQAASWLKSHMDENYTIDTTPGGERKLLSQGKITPALIDSKTFFYRKKIDGYLYLDYNNVVNRELVFENKIYDMSEYSDAISGINKLYSNGGSEVYR